MPNRIFPHKHLFEAAISLSHIAGKATSRILLLKLGIQLAFPLLDIAAEATNPETQVHATGRATDR